MHHRKPNRLPGYDYSNDNLYFVTSVVHNRVCCFGEVSNGKMVLNENGIIARDQWDWLAVQYPYITLHEFVVMPNHIHGIIEIKRHFVRKTETKNDAELVNTEVADLWKYQPTMPVKIKSLSELMGAYKTTTSKKIHSAGNKTFNWQRSFHDHIVRNDNSFGKIARYIKYNPAKWERDRFFAGIKFVR